MKNLFSVFSKSLLASILFSGLAFNSCWAGLIFELENAFQFSKSDQTILHLDRNRYKGTAATSDWTSNRKNVTYVINGIAIWEDPSNFYFELEGTYGRLFSGKTIGFPLTWNVRGHQAGFVLETGYIYDVDKRFKLIPQLGFSYTQYFSHLSNQHQTHESPNIFVSRNGDKTRTLLYYPYIGLQVSVPGEVNGFKYQLSVSYDLGFGSGYSRIKVPRFFVTDLASSSRFGSHMKLRDIIVHDFELICSHPLADHWIFALEFDYNFSYNTRKLPVKLEHNKRIVEAGLYTPTQYHVCNKNITRNWTVILNLVYSFGESATIIH